MKSGSTTQLELREALPLNSGGEVPLAQTGALKQAGELATGLLLFSLLVSVLALGEGYFREQCLASFKSFSAALQGVCVTDYLLSPWLWGAFLGALIFEKISPARIEKGEGSLSFYAAFDFLWSLPKLAFFATLWPLFTLALQAVYSKYLSFLTIHAFDSTPWLFRLILGVLIADFAHWGSHLLRHKISQFWEFHSIHHAQRHLNFFTEYRSHIFDDVLKLVLEALPLFMLQHSFVQVLLVNQLRYWHTTIYHANIKSNFGILRYILVTPQSHRIHHSLEPGHADKNFGLTFSIWDHLFGTQYRNYDEYPETGISSPSYEMESRGTSARKSRLIAPFIQQFFFPLRFSALSEERSDRGQYFPALTAIRFLLALGVLCIHYDGLILPGLISPEFKHGAGTNLVPAFFCLAGFILAWQYKKIESLACLYRYFSARIARIFPLYWFSLFLALAIGPLSCLCPDLRQFPALCFFNFSLLQAWCHDSTFYYGLNPPAYSLSMEAFYYCLFPLLVVLSKKGCFPALLALQLLLEFGVAWLVPVENSVYEMGVKPLSHLSDFMLGLAAAAYLDKSAFDQKFGKLVFLLCSVLELLCVLLFFLWPLYSTKLFALGVTPIMGMAFLFRRVGSMAVFGFFCCLLAWRKGLLSMILARPVFVYLGELSYAIFLIHQVLIRGSVFHFLGLKAFGLPGFFCFFAFVLGLSALTFRFVETPWRRTLLDFFRQLSGRTVGTFFQSFYLQGKGRQIIALFLPFLLLIAVPQLVVRKESLISFSRGFLLPALPVTVAGTANDDVDSGAGWTLLAGSQNSIFAQAACLEKIMAHYNEDKSIDLVAHWRGEQEAEKAKFVGVHLLNARQEIVHQLDHQLLPTNMTVGRNSRWLDRITIAPYQRHGITTLGLAVFEDPQKTYEIASKGKCDWGNHRLLIALPVSEGKEP